MPGPLALVSVPTESCRIDWVSLSYDTKSDDQVEDLLRETYRFLDGTFPGEGWGEVRPSKHFENMRTHGSKVRIHWTFLSERRGAKSAPNPGRFLIEMSGEPLGRMSSETRMDSLSYLTSLRGFRGASRLDCQRTWLDPLRTAEEIVMDFRRGDLWCIGYSQVRDHCWMDHRGQPRASATQYIGSPKGRKYIRIYNKGVEAGWEEEALRVEVQYRREPAAQHLNAMLARFERESPEADDPTTAEERTVNDLIAQDVRLRDTSRWRGGERPQNWADAAPTPQWWEEMLDHVPEHLAVEYEDPKDLQRVWDNMLFQYGRKFALEALRQCIANGLGPSDFGAEFVDSCMARLKEEDVDVLYQVLRDVPRERVKEVFDQALSVSAWNTERNPVRGESKLPAF